MPDRPSLAQLAADRATRRAGLPPTDVPAGPVRTSQYVELEVPAEGLADGQSVVWDADDDRWRPAAVSSGPSGVPSVARAASFALATSDNGKAQDVSSAGAVVVTVPADADAAFPLDAVVEVCRLGTGAVTIAAAGGVTIVSAGGRLALAERYSTASLRKRAANTWVLAGDLA